MLPARTRRWLFWSPLAIALVLVLVWLLRPRAVAVDFATIVRGPLQVTVSDEGETRVKELFVVSAPVSGFMRRIELQAGDAVTAGNTAIARIEPSDPVLLDPRSRAEARAAVSAAEAARTLAAAAVERARANALFTERELTRFRALLQRESLAQADLDAAEQRARAAAASLEEAQAALRMRSFELEQARARLLTPAEARRGGGALIVHSPVSGRVLRVLQESAGVVGPGTPLVEVGDPHALEIVVDLPSTEAVGVAPGQRVVVEFWGGPQPLQGRVRRVEPFGFTKISALGVEEQRVNVIVDLTSPPEQWHALGHGYRVEPRIVLWEAQQVLKAPLSALFRAGEHWAAFVHEDGRAVLRHVTLGAKNSLEAQVLEGLQAGDEVVLHPSGRVGAGNRLAQRD